MEDKETPLYMRDFKIPLISYGPNVPYPSFWYKIISSFSPKQFALFALFTIIFLASATGIMRKIGDAHLVVVPLMAGELREGVIGAPRFINPLLAVSQADRDLSQLIYAGLMKPSANGGFEGELAESIHVSDDGLTYIFTLRRGLKWHDGKDLTADDVVFTVNKAQDPSLKSPKRASFEGVLATAKDTYTVQFVLSQPFASFMENTTMGILPRHLWADIASDVFPFSLLNSGAVGSGPYMIERIVNDKRGIPLYFDLEPFQDYALGSPYIKRIKIRFYPGSEELLNAYEKGEIESVAALSGGTVSELRKDGAHAVGAPLPRIFGVFWNQNQAEIFRDKAVREALDLSASRSFIVETVLSGYGVPIDGPIPPGSLGEPTKEELLSISESSLRNKERAIELLESAGWKQNEEDNVRYNKGRKLSFTLSTADTPELKDAAMLLKTGWDSIGAEVTLKIYELGDLNQNVIRPRKYEALFFGTVVGREPDLFAFWHSSQRNDPGLNISMYTNSKVDKMLEGARRTIVRSEREDLMREIATTIKSDSPATFVYSPLFLYILPEKVKGVDLGAITTTGDRFSTVSKWHIETERVWRYFLDK
ncbi:MAG: hypothetical protein COV07_01565 [Candidatus Vogelbacteria bacterium CG10_big_fil_rev_8_21_14_0_10_45_14]|uniref:Solute-binding protein family 5 domain-containing protein n=1 Tax=Candidatus Vogelbacteria bacterium CG10_big_fil_rev_8_21_14_0_10_45_14 TaxID=1975042 RepID=A0A2H0RKD9_9BACT|nr:MAG: hypothetical protein COV07_01565 [Candidatus Vogelbacteria bacterium CG10_big_fil_rev_8_21_14_0_10_45_14]